ncbi:MAG: ATP-binding protein [Smithella sp.]
MALLTKGSIKQKLIWISLLTTSIALFLTCGMLVISELLFNRQMMMERLDVQAQIIGTNSTAALVFKDKQAAAEILKALNSSPNIVCAALKDEDGGQIASYLRSSDTKQCHWQHIKPDIPNFGINNLDIIKTIKHDDEIIGSLYIHTDLTDIYKRLLWGVIIVLGAVLLSMAAAYVLLSRLQRIITQPLFHMADIMRTISEKKDYSVRVNIQDKDEIGILGEGFNEMLTQIQKRETELAFHRENLQAKVAERTRELADANAELQLQLSERQRMEEEKLALVSRLNRAEKMEALGTMAGGVAHDLNNVLGVMTGYAELLMMSLPPDSPLLKFADNIFTSSKKGGVIIQDLLTLARRGVTVSTVIDINNVVSNYLNTPVHRKLAGLHPEVTFALELSPSTLNMKGSPVHMEKTIMNLVTNAAEAIAGEGAVTIRTENLFLDKPVHGYDSVTAGEYVALSVSDTGTGISPENIAHIFEPFYTKKKMGRSGTGLGLTIVWGTVKDHDGYLDVISEQGKGSTFILYFPVTREETAEKEIQTPVDGYMGKGEKILVVDDIAEQRNIARDIMVKLGYQVHTVSGGEEALEYLTDNDADLVILDMIMEPGIDGLETYRRIIEIKPRQKAIIVSGFSETEKVRRAQELGAGAYVQKPYIIEKIGAAVRDELQKY